MNEKVLLGNYAVSRKQRQAQKLTMISQVFFRPQQWIQFSEQCQ